MQSSNRLKIYFICFVIIVTGVIYIPSVTGEYIYDSQQIPGLGVSYSGALLDIAVSGYADLRGNVLRKGLYYRPVTSLSFVLFQDWGAEGQRYVNIVLFWGSLIFLMLFLNLIMDGNILIYPFLLVFALYPLHVDNVLWVVGRGDLLLIFFFFAMLWCMELAGRSGKSMPAVAGVICFILGIFSKEAMALLLPAIVLNEYSRRERNYKSLIVVGVFTLIFFVVKAQVVGMASGDLKWPSDLMGFIQTLLGTSGFYFKTGLLPFNHQIFATYSSLHNSVNMVAGLILLMFLFAGAWWGWKKNRRLLFALGLIAFMIPHMVVVFTSIEPFKASSRYMALPFAGFLFFIIFLLAGRKKISLVFPVTLILVLVMGVSSFLHTEVYKSESSYWNYYLNQEPDNSFFLAKKVHALLIEENVIEASSILNRLEKIELESGSLSSGMIQMLRLKVFERQCNYAAVNIILRKLEKSNDSFEILRAAALSKARLLCFKGDLNGALKSMKTAVSRFGPRDFADLIMRIYIGNLEWGKAATFQRRYLQYLEASDLKQNIAELKRAFTDYPLFEKAIFFERMHSYKKAVMVLNNLEQSPGVELHKVFSYLRMGDKERAENSITFLRESTRGLKLLVAFFSNKIPILADAIRYCEEYMALKGDDKEMSAYLEYLRGLKK